MSTLQRFKLSGLKYVDLAEEGPDAVPAEPHGELTIERNGTDAFQFQLGGRLVVMRGAEVKQLLYVLCGYDSSPSCRLSADYKAPTQPPHPGFRDDQIRAMVREEIAAALQDGSR